MIRFLEKTIFLRSFNYLRVSHDYSLLYNVIYPLLFAVFITVIFSIFDTSANLFEKDSLINSFVPVLSILTPFYIAALAAVSTFSGLTQIDKPFEMKKPVLLEVIGKGGDWEFIDVTPRHFLSLLFGYCTATSILLLTISIFLPSLKTGLFFYLLFTSVLFCFLLLLYFSF